MITNGLIKIDLLKVTKIGILHLVSEKEIKNMKNTISKWKS